MYSKAAVEMTMRSKKIKVDDTGTKLLEDFFLQTVTFLEKTDRKLLTRILGRFSYIDSEHLDQNLTPRQQRSIAESFTGDHSSINLKRKRYKLSYHQSKMLGTPKAW